MKIFFIRHGETTGDVENLYGGTYDDHLSEKGIEQSKKLAELLKDKGIEIIFSSSLIRAQETSKLLSEVANCEIQVVPELRERNQYGFLSGTNKDEAKQKYPKEVEMLKDRLNTIEGAETYEDFSKHVSDAFASIVNSSKYSSVAIVSHGGPLRVLFRDILKWGELTEIGDCAYAELEKIDEDYRYIAGANFKADFKIE
ncbi:MAG: histidine phosphatase family protein [Minisyncoccia bacterium]